MELDAALRAALDQRRAKSLYRQRAVIESPQQVVVKRNGKQYLSFCSNDYLGLANHPEVKAAFYGASQRCGVGSGASHLVSGHTLEHHQLEEALARFTGRDRALLFSTGYMANLSVIDALVGREDSVFEDRLNHASLLDGARLSRAKLQRFRHGDLSHLEQQLMNSSAVRKLIVVDGVFSMDGDMADLPALAEMAQRHQAWLMVDDAHGFGCLGSQGGGVLEHYGMSQSEVPIVVGTLGKAFGTFGAFVAGSEVLIESLIQFARTYIYTTALPPAVAVATAKALELVQHDTDRREHLSLLIASFKHACDSHQVELMDSSTPIQPVIVGEAELALAMSEYLQEQGIWVGAIRPPTVPVGSARLRVTLCAEHTVQQVELLASKLAEAQRACQL